MEEEPILEYIWLSSAILDSIVKSKGHNVLLYAYSYEIKHFPSSILRAASFTLRLNASITENDLLF